MPDLPAKVRRAALEALGRDTLANLTSKFDVAVQDRRSAAAHVDALMRSRTVEFSSLLGELQRDDLKAICEAIGIDPSGREKGVLAERILAGPDGATPLSVAGNGAAAAAPDEPAPGGKLTIDQLEAYLWGAADKLRGKIDSSDYKSFIFGFLFLKRLSDVFEEEAEKLIAAGTAPEVAWEDRDYHRFYVPKRARWSSIQKQATGIGDYLNKACAALEEENTSLEGVLRGIDYNDENKLGHAKERDELLARLVHHFSKVSLRNADLAEPDMLGRAYEFLIERFADDAGKKGGEFYTPRKVVQLIVELLEPKETDRICDPTVGSGGMLLLSAKYIESHGGDPRKLTLHGQEKNLGTWAICKMNMLLHGLADARIEKGDTIRDPKLVSDGALEVYDRVVANPPFSLKDWGQDHARADIFRRFRILPPANYGDLAFVQHMLATLAPGGRVGVVLPYGALSREGSETDVRKMMIEEDLVDAVVALPPNLFYRAGVLAAVCVLRKDKPTERRGRVMFINATEGFEQAVRRNVLRDADIARITDACRSGIDQDGYARSVTADEIRARNFDLLVSSYVRDVAQAGSSAPLDGQWARFENVARERATSEGRLGELLSPASFTMATSTPKQTTNFGELPASWRPWTLGDLLTPVKLPVEVSEDVTYREIGIRSHFKGIFHKDPCTGGDIGAKRVFWIQPSCLIFNIVFAWEGAVAVTGGHEEGFIGSHRFPMFRTDPEFAKPEFLLAMFQLPEARHLLRTVSPGGAGRNKTLNQGRLLKARLALPPVTSQEAFLVRTRAIANAVAASALVSQELASVQDALIREYFSGTKVPR